MTGSPPPDDVGRLTRRSLLRGGIALGAAALGWGALRWPGWMEDNIPGPLRRVLRFNERLSAGLIGPARLAPEFAPTAADEPQVNGEVGDPKTMLPFLLNVAGARTFMAADFAGLPRVTSTTELKCIEGWSQVVSWGGVRLADFLDKFQLGRRADGSRLPYLALTTADGAYFVGLDLASACHPQTLLCDSMNGGPLPANHGGPLRLVIPVKYGIKNIKWLSRMAFTDERPADYWAQRGYDWFAGL